MTASSQTNDSELIDIQVNDLAYGGGFIGQVVAGPVAFIGKKALINFVAPGEKVKATIEKNEKRLVYASLLQIIESSSTRIDAPCKYFTTCGGCHLQHLSIEEQRQQKLKLVSNTLKFQAGLEAKNPIELIGNDLPEFSYRDRVSLHLNSLGLLGFYRTSSGDVVDIENCLLANEKINIELSKIRSWTKKLCNYVGGIGIEINCNTPIIILKLKDEHTTKLSPEILEFLKAFPNVLIQLKDKTIFQQLEFNELTNSSKHPAGHFSQVNSKANKILVDLVCSLVNTTLVTDLYAGSGNFSLPLARLGKKVTAVEVDPVLIKHGKELIKKESLNQNLKFVESSCESYVRLGKLEETVILDPPRSGAKQILSNIIDGKTKNIIYVSCNLPSLMRDLKILKESGFTLEKIFVLDMFPQTHHVETVSLLTR